MPDKIALFSGVTLAQFTPRITADIDVAYGSGQSSTVVLDSKHLPDFGKFVSQAMAAGALP